MFKTVIDLANLTSSQGFVLQGAAAGDRTGYTVGNIGDVNKDGYDDIIIGADSASPNGRANAGAAYIIFGKANGFSSIDLANLQPSQGFVIQGAVAGDYSKLS